MPFGHSFYNLIQLCIKYSVAKLTLLENHKKIDERKMNIFSFTLKSILISFMIFYLGSVSATDPKNKNAPKLEYFGSLTYRDIGEVKNFSRNFVAISEVEL